MMNHMDATFPKNRLLQSLSLVCLLAAVPAFGQNPGQLIQLPAQPYQVDAGSPSFSLAVKGGNFVQGSTVYWGTRALFTLFIDASNLSATITSDLLAVSGQNQITVQNPNGAVSGFAYVYVNPVLYNVNPNSLPLGSSAQTITVFGMGFNSSDVLQLNPVGSVNNLATTYVSPATLTAQVPASLLAKSANAAVQVVQSGCCLSKAVYLQIGIPPVISTTTPSSVTSGTPGFFLTVNGSNFQPGAVVYFNGNAVPTTYVNSSQVNAQVPASPSLSVLNPIPVYVLNSDGGTSNAVSIAVTSAGAVISGLFPASGTAGMGDFTMTVNGSGFLPGARVLWNGTALNTTFNSSGQLLATVPASLTSVPGSASIAVQNPGASVSAAQSFTFPGPHISVLQPSTIGAGSSDFTLAIGGSAFLNTSTVQWGGSALSTTFVNSTQLNAAVPSSLVLTPATVSITVSNSGTLSNSVPFAVAPPSIVTINPSNASAGSNGFTLTITGSGYTPTTQVQWNGTLLPVVFLATSQVTASIPPNLLTTPGTVQISVLNPGGSVSNNIAFTLNPPVITQLNPAFAAVGGSLVNLVVSGTGFASGSQVLWNSTPLVTNFISTFQLNARVTADLLTAAGTAAVSVQSPGGAKSNAVTFTIGSGGPSITTLSPAAATAGGPAFALTVNGSGFPSDSVVQWNGSTLSTAFVNGTQLTASVPASLIATSGTATIQVSSSAGASNAVTFTINSISVVNAASNQPAIAPGSLISIYGTNLASTTATAAQVPWPPSLGNVSVTINGVAAPLYYVSSTQINAQVPFETQPGNATLSVSSGGSAAFPVTTTGPGIFLAQNFSDGNANSAGDPVAAGQYLVIYMTGQGAVDNPVATGAAAGSSPLSNSIAKVTATVGGQNAQVLFAGLTPGLVGVLQVDLQVPAVASGSQPLIVTIGGVPSNTLSVAIR